VVAVSLIFVPAVSLIFDDASGQASGDADADQRKKQRNLEFPEGFHRASFQHLPGTRVSGAVLEPRRAAIGPAVSVI
jgi:hypothetical protein